MLQDNSYLGTLQRAQKMRKVMLWANRVFRVPCALWADAPN